MATGPDLELFRYDQRVFYGHLRLDARGFLATPCVSPADAIGGIALANATSGPDIAAIAVDPVTIVADHEPRIAVCTQPPPDVEVALLAPLGWRTRRPTRLRPPADRRA